MNFTTSAVSGDPLPFEQFRTFTDLEKIYKQYKVSQAERKKGEAFALDGIITSIASQCALRS